MASLGIVLHGADQQARSHAIRLVARLHAEKHRVRAVADDMAAGAFDTSDMVELVSREQFGEDLDLVISLGGDGTILRTVGLLAGANTKILGVNFGDLGYLTVTEPEDIDTAVDAALLGEHEVEDRMLVQGLIDGVEFHALNDIVVERAPGDTTVRLAVILDGQRFTAYSADGLIVATPTGSTAYALSARGPVVQPTHESLQITPVSPHMLFDRTLVMSADTDITLTVEGHRSAVVSVDGHTMADMLPGQSITCRRSERVARLVTFGPRDHFGVLTSKLSLGDR